MLYYLSRGLTAKLVMSRGLAEKMHNRNVGLFHLLFGTPLLSFCTKQNYSAFVSYLCPLLLCETYHSPLLGQVISSISAEHGSSHLECCVLFQVPRHKMDSGMD